MIRFKVNVMSLLPVLDNFCFVVPAFDYSFNQVLLLVFSLSITAFVF